MKFENVSVFNFENAIRGMRNPLESWSRMDSDFSDPKKPLLGPNDLRLATNLITGGSPHRKFLRQIFISVDITAPIYWWKEMDTYKVGTTANSTSTMHKISCTPITMERFETDDFTSRIYDKTTGTSFEIELPISTFINFLEQLRVKFIETKDERYWKELIRWLPEGWVQTRTMTMTYENILNIDYWREPHKLSEWHQFYEFSKTLPYIEDFLAAAKKNPPGTK